MKGMLRATANEPSEDNLEEDKICRLIPDKRGKKRFLKGLNEKKKKKQETEKKPEEKPKATLMPCMSHKKNEVIKGQKRDIIEEYANFGSTVYAPITRDGLSLDKKANKYEVQPEALSSYQGIEELSRSLPAKVFQSKISVDKFKFNYMSKLTRRES